MTALVIGGALFAFIKPSQWLNTDYNVCDSTATAEINYFEIAIQLKPLENILNKMQKTTIQNGEVEVVLQKTDNKWLLTNPKNELSKQEKIATLALVAPVPNLYQRWQEILKEPRANFLLKRQAVQNKIQEIWPSFTVSVISDIRLADTQKALLLKGASASPLSQHQFGFASDFAIKNKGKYLTSYKYYIAVGTAAKENNITWGGNFAGFIDPGHIQEFSNSASLLSKIPALRYEFIDFLPYYKTRIQKMESLGKEKDIKDTQELVQILELMNENKLCTCQNWPLEKINTYLKNTNSKEVNIKINSTNNTIELHFEKNIVFTNKFGAFQ